MLDRPIEAIEELRERAADCEAALDPARRKRLGQFFTGISLGRVLAAISFRPETKTVLDPMAGSGDLLDAVLERAQKHSIPITGAHGVEIDAGVALQSEQRLGHWKPGVQTLKAEKILVADAFSQAASDFYSPEGYDLVITNPPYVRYQRVATQDGGSLQVPPDVARASLRGLIDLHCDAREREIWRTLVDNYSGLADLSVPSWLLSAMLVRPGGHLAIVAPATWRSRNYGDVIQYLLARCFQIEYVVEDTQPGWFSDALVRTQLVVARRLPADTAAVPLSSRAPSDAVVVNARVSPSASSDESLLGAAFADADPNDAFASWLRHVKGNTMEPPIGVSCEVHEIDELSATILGSFRTKKWFAAVEPPPPAGLLFGEARESSASFLIPVAVRSSIATAGVPKVRRPAEAGVSVSQGLRTGCNGFFYVDRLRSLSDGEVLVRLSELFGGDEIAVPAECLVPVLRRQSEYDSHLPLDHSKLQGQALNLSGWILPEDQTTARSAEILYRRSGEPLPRVMPDALAAHVRRAAQTRYGDGANASLIPQLSAVRTNVRNSVDRPPRFWYMMPQFAPRHRGDIFIPRISQGIPEVTQNSIPAALIDANFSTLWGNPPWSSRSLEAIFSSSWCRACMEALGTPMGGGALKLEATQLNQMPLPVLDDDDLDSLDERAGESSTSEAQVMIDRFVLQKLFPSLAEADLDAVDAKLRAIADTLCANRQKRNP